MKGLCFRSENNLVKKASLLIRNGRIYTVDKRRSRAEALAVHDGRIIFVGTNEQAEDFTGPDTRIVDAKGRMVLPGFIDSHVHYASGYMEASWVELSSASSLDDIFEMTSEHARKHPGHRLVGGFGWEYEAAQSKGKLPTKEDLDGIVSDRPVLLISYDAWTGLANSRFIELAVEALRKRSSTLGDMERDPDTGEPTGVFYDPYDLAYMGGSVSELIRENELEGLREVIGQANRVGITSIHEAQADVRDLEAFQQLRSEGALNVRVHNALYHHRETKEEDLARFKELRSRYSDEWIKAGAVKLFIDGVPESHTAAMLDAYSDRPSTKGETKFEPKEFNDIVERFDRMGFQCLVHACGDRGVRTALDAYENAMNRNGRRDSRHRIEHIEIVSDQDIPRFKQLGVIACVQPEYWEYAPDAPYYLAFGSERMKRAYRLKSLLSAGAVLALSSDWFIADINPLVGIQGAVSRGRGFGQEQEISLADAIEGYTMNGAYASFEEDVKGSLEPGKFADIVILSEDLFEMPPDKISEAKVLMTILGGNEVYRSEEF
jgi:hypothetical protein